MTVQSILANRSRTCCSHIFCMVHPYIAMHSKTQQMDEDVVMHHVKNGEVPLTILAIKYNCA